MGAWQIAQIFRSDSAMQKMYFLPFRAENSALKELKTGPALDNQRINAFVVRYRVDIFQKEAMLFTKQEKCFKTC